MTKLPAAFDLHPLPAELLARFEYKLTELDLRRRISVKHAAALNDIHEASFRRHYPHLIEKTTERRDGVTLANALSLPPPSKDREVRPRRGSGPIPKDRPADT